LATLPLTWTRVSGDVEDALGGACDRGLVGGRAEDGQIVEDVEVAVGVQVFVAGAARHVDAGTEHDDVVARRLVGRGDRIAQRAVGIADTVGGVARRGRQEDRRSGGGCCAERRHQGERRAMDFQRFE
jgi:hypothetical protein